MNTLQSVTICMYVSKVCAIDGGWKLLLTDQIQSVCLHLSTTHLGF